MTEALFVYELCLYTRLLRLRGHTKTIRRSAIQFHSSCDHGNTVSLANRLTKVNIPTVVMPSKQELCMVAKNDLQTDYLARDVEELVCEIKENLRLKAKPHRTQAQRPSPYSRPERSTRRPEPPAPAAIEDPYEMLQHLLESNSLVAEAVRRLQEGLGPKQRFFYDDEDEVPLLNYPLGV